MPTGLPKFALQRQKIAYILRELEPFHAEAEKRLPKHDWQDWYGAYLDARMNRGCDQYDSALLANTAIRVKIGMLNAACGGCHDVSTTD